MNDDITNDFSPQQQQHQKQNKQQQHVRACDACHSIKVKCVQEGPDATPCGRCSRLKIPCKFTPRVRKKHKKRTDARVAVLEREVESLRSALAARVQISGGGGQPSRSDSAHRGFGTSSFSSPAAVTTDDGRPEKGVAVRSGTQSDDNDDDDDSGAYNKATTLPVSMPQDVRSKYRAADLDAIRRGVASPENVASVMGLFGRQFVLLYPVVQIEGSSSSWSSAAEFAARRPLLLQAVIGVAAIVTDPGRARGLQVELTRSYAATLLSDTPKSLDLVQANLVLLAWHIPPKNFSNRRFFYQLAHLAFSTALELGLSGDDQHEDDDDEPRDDIVDGTPVERARTYIGCYMLSQGISLTMRRTSMLKTTEGLTRCLELLETSAEATEYDKTLVSNAKLFQIAESISDDLGSKKATRGLDISNEWIQSRIRHYRARLEQWHEDAGLRSLEGPILLMYHYIMVYLNEIALYQEHHPQDFIAPFKLERVGLTNVKTTSPPSDSNDNSVTSSGSGNNNNNNGEVSSCLLYLVKSAHALMDLFISYPVEMLRTIPVQNYFRLVYVAFVLTKLSMSPLDPRSDLGRIIDRRLLRTEYYRATVEGKIRTASENGRYAIPAVFLSALHALSRHWIELEKKLTMETMAGKEIGGQKEHGSESVSNGSSCIVREGVQGNVHGGDVHGDGSGSIERDTSQIGQTSANTTNLDSGSVRTETGFPVAAGTDSIGQQNLAFMHMEGMDLGQHPSESDTPAPQMPMDMDMQMQDAIFGGGLSDIPGLTPELEAWTTEDLDTWVGMMESHGQSETMWP